MLRGHPRIIIVLLVTGLFADRSGADDGQVPQWLLRVPDSVATVLVADTSNATLHEYSFESGSPVRRQQHYMSIGQKGIRKERAGDRKTPLGIYFITEQLDTSRLHEKYGVTAFPLDYPNTLDRNAGRTGDGIWLHGVTPGPGRRPERDTDGCIAIPNENLTALATRLELLDTPVIVTTEMLYTSPAETAAAGQQLAAGVWAWSQAQESADVLGYLALYADDFRYRGLSRSEWASFRSEQFLEGPRPTVEVRDLLVLQDPVDTSMFITRFIVERSDSNGNTLTSRKRLYWQHQASGDYRIVAEDNG